MIQSTVLQQEVIRHPPAIQRRFRTWTGLWKSRPEVPARSEPGDGFYSVLFCSKWRISGYQWHPVRTSNWAESRVPRKQPPLIHSTQLLLLAVGDKRWLDTSCSSQSLHDNGRDGQRFSNKSGQVEISDVMKKQVTQQWHSPHT